MSVPTDRLLIMFVAATGFAIVFGGWAIALINAEATGWEEIGLRVGVGAVFFLVLIGIWYVFTGIDREESA